MLPVTHVNLPEKGQHASENIAHNVRLTLRSAVLSGTGVMANTTYWVHCTLVDAELPIIRGTRTCSIPTASGISLRGHCSHLGDAHGLSNRRFALSGRLNDIGLLGVER